MNTAVIDIGSNTLLLLIVDACGEPVVDLCRFGRLGQGLEASGRLADAAIARSLEILREYRELLDLHGVVQPAVIATQATREAANAPSFVIPAEEILGATIEVIAGTREADLALRAVAQTLPELAGSRYVVVDVGGGSTEVIVSDGARVSLPIGAVRLTERHLHGDPPTATEIAALEADIDQHLAPLALPAGGVVVGTAGTATTIAALHLALATYDPVRVTGLRLAPSVVDAQLARLYAATIAERRGMPGLEPERADVIAGGVAILARILRRIGASELITSDRGIRWGLAYERMAAAGAGRAAPAE